MTATVSGPGRRMVTLAGLLFAALTSGGCASSPPAPTAQIQAAQQAIDEAERAQAARHAASELGQARTKLASANNAVQSEDMDQALRLATEARVDAELASARTAAAKARSANDEIRESTRMLVEELERKTGGTP
jgi:uncharacterized lipoprotein YmbA